MPRLRGTLPGILSASWPPRRYPPSGVTCRSSRIDRVRAASVTPQRTYQDARTWYAGNWPGPRPAARPVARPTARDTAADNLMRVPRRGPRPLRRRHRRRLMPAGQPRPEILETGPDGHPRRQSQRRGAGGRRHRCQRQPQHEHENERFRRADSSPATSHRQPTRSRSTDRSAGK